MLMGLAGSSELEALEQAPSGSGQLRGDNVEGTVNERAFVRRQTSSDAHRSSSSSPSRCISPQPPACAGSVHAAGALCGRIASIRSTHSSLVLPALIASPALQLIAYICMCQASCDIASPFWWGCRPPVQFSFSVPASRRSRTPRPRADQSGTQP
jgi:hypothetical protein